MAKTKSRRQREADEIIRRLKTPPPVIKNEEENFDLSERIMQILTAKMAEEIEKEVMFNAAMTSREKPPKEEYNDDRTQGYIGTIFERGKLCRHITPQRIANLPSYEIKPKDDES